MRFLPTLADLLFEISAHFFWFYDTDYAKSQRVFLTSLRRFGGTCVGGLRAPKRPLPRESSKCNLQVGFFRCPLSTNAHEGVRRRIRPQVYVTDTIHVERFPPTNTIAQRWLILFAEHEIVFLDKPLTPERSFRRKPVRGRNLSDQALTNP